MRSHALVWVLPVASGSAAAANGCGGGESVTSSPDPGWGSTGDASADAKDAAPDGAGGAAGSAGGAGQAGVAGAGGQSGGAGQAGVAGAAGYAGAQAGAAGEAGASGSAGTSGQSGAAGSAGAPSDAGGGDAGQGGPCLKDADCAGGLTCQVAANSGNTALELRCEPIVGANGTGYPCTSGSTCRSGICIQGFCSTPCSSAADCTQAGTCSSQSVTVGALTGTFDVCVVAPCDNNQDCDPGEVCSDLQIGGGVVRAFCRQPQNTGGGLGDPCTAPSGCTSMLCPSWFQSCTEVCSADADCSAMTNGICVDLASSGTSTVAGCARGCERASDCPSGKTCVITTDTADDLHKFVCGPGGTDPTGSDCSTINKCSSGLRLSNYSGGQLVDQICTQPCVTAADCPVGYGVCADVQMSTPSGNGTHLLQLCNHP